MIFRFVSLLSVIALLLTCSMPLPEAFAGSHGMAMDNGKPLTPLNPAQNPTAPAPSTSLPLTPLTPAPVMTQGSPTAPQVTPPAGATHLMLFNKSANDVICGITVPVCPAPPAPCIMQDGCAQLASYINIIDKQASPQQFALTPFGTSAPQNGYFTLKAGHIVEVINTMVNPQTNTAQNCLQGLIISFGQWNSCPCTGTNCPAFVTPFVPGPALPNGSNAAEPSLNLPGTINGSSTGAGQNESCDITCVNGANSTIQCVLSAPSAGPFWSYDNVSNIQNFTTQNSWVNIAEGCDDNCVISSGPGTGGPRPGVYPYGCDTCTTTTVAPCPAPNNFCHPSYSTAKGGCNFQRSPLSGQVFGGTVQFNYLGPLSPPATCPQ